MFLRLNYSSPCPYKHSDTAISVTHQFRKDFMWTLIRSLETQVLKPGGGRAMLQRLYEDYLMAKLQQRAGSRAAAGGAGNAGEMHRFPGTSNSCFSWEPYFESVIVLSPKIPICFAVAAVAVLRGVHLKPAAERRVSTSSSLDIARITGPYSVSCAFIPQQAPAGGESAAQPGCRRLGGAGDGPPADAAGAGSRIGAQQAWIWYSSSRLDASAHWESPTQPGNPVQIGSRRIASCVLPAVMTNSSDGVPNSMSPACEARIDVRSCRRTERTDGDTVSF